MKKLLANVFAVERRDERENIQRWEDCGNKMLLWHGTKSENLVGILQTGFRIAPAGVSRSGSMFGNGKKNSKIFSSKINILKETPI